MALETSNSLHSWGTWRGVLLPGTLRYSNIWAPFLGPREC